MKDTAAEGSPTLLFILQQPCMAGIRCMGRFQATGHLETHTKLEANTEELILRSHAGHSFYFDAKQAVKLEEVANGGGFWVVDSNKTPYRLVPYTLIPLI